MRNIYIIPLLLACFSLADCGPDLSKYESLKTPTLGEKPGQKMLVVEFKGPPKETAGKAFGLLYRVYYKLDDADAGVKENSPRARWPLPPETPRDEWLGVFGLPVSADIKKIPDEVRKEYPAVKLEFWEYGKVAEVLHVGPYDTETPTTEKLLSFIEAQKLKITGSHEEEYLKGPGLFFKGDENQYHTIIRYPVATK